MSRTKYKFLPERDTRASSFVEAASSSFENQAGIELTYERRSDSTETIDLEDFESEAIRRISLQPVEDYENETVDGYAPDVRIVSSDRQQRQWAVVLFSVTIVLLFADQNLLAPNLTAVAEEFHFSNDERDRKLGGDIALAFFLLGAPASFLVGCLADRFNRSVLFAITVGIGEGACLATFFSRSYNQLYICRAVTGFSLGGATPLMYSVLGDLFAAEDRHAVNAIVGMGTGLGIGVGQGIAGFLGPTFGWRCPFLVVSIPALACAAAVLLTVPDPERGAMEKAVLQQRRGEVHFPAAISAESYFNLHCTHPETSGNGAFSDGVPVARRKSAAAPAKMGSEPDELESLHLPPRCDSGDVCGRHLGDHIKTFLSLLSCPTVLLLILQGAPGCIPWGIVNTFLNDFLSEDRGMSVERATMVLLAFGFGNFLGLVVGGAGGKFLYKLDPRYPPLLAGTTGILACFPFWVLLNNVAISSHLISAGLISILTGIGTGVTGPIMAATLQNVTLPTTRGQAFAMSTLLNDIGVGFGPFFVARMIVGLGGRTKAFNVGTIGWVLCGVLNLAVFFTVAEDEVKVQATLAAGLQGGSNDPSSESESAAVKHEAVVSFV